MTHHDLINDLHIEIMAHIYELHDLQQVIKNMSGLDEDDIYMEEVGDRYMKMCDKLRILLEAYFAEQDKLGLPTELNYRKLYKKLKS